MEFSVRLNRGHNHRQSEEACCCVRQCIKCNLYSEKIKEDGQNGDYSIHCEEKLGQKCPYKQTDDQWTINRKGRVVCS